MSSSGTHGPWHQMVMVSIINMAFEAMAHRNSLFFLFMVICSITMLVYQRVFAILWIFGFTLHDTYTNQIFNIEYQLIYCRTNAKTSHLSIKKPNYWNQKDQKCITLYQHTLTKLVPLCFPKHSLKFHVKFSMNSDLWTFERKWATWTRSKMCSWPAESHRKIMGNVIITIFHGKFHYKLPLSIVFFPNLTWVCLKM